MPGVQRMMALQQAGGVGISGILAQIAQEGYAVASVDYALIPDYRYPTPVRQLDQAVHFLQKNAETYGLDMKRVVFGGGSAGGQIAGQYVNIQTNSKYAEEMGVRQCLNEKYIKGCVFDCALLQPAKFNEINTLEFLVMFTELKNLYFGRKRAVLDQADVISHITPSFPPVFATDGNHGTFNLQLGRLHEKLKECGVSCDYVYYPQSEAKLEHGYDTDLTNSYAMEALQKKLQFLDRILNLG